MIFSLVIMIKHLKVFVWLHTKILKVKIFVRIYSPYSYLSILYEYIMFIFYVKLSFIKKLYAQQTLSNFQL